MPVTNHWSIMKTGTSYESMQDIRKAGHERSSSYPVYKPSKFADDSVIMQCSDCKGYRLEKLPQKDHKTSDRGHHRKYGMRRSKTTLSNSFHDRAKQGFAYWPQEQKVPPKYTSYSIGARNTFLGLGNAPRS